MAFKGLAYFKTPEIMSHAQNMLTVINDFHINNRLEGNSGGAADITASSARAIAACIPSLLRCLMGFTAEPAKRCPEINSENSGAQRQIGRAHV
jgi:hypothetical protein